MPIFVRWRTTSSCRRCGLFDKATFFTSLRLRLNKSRSYESHTQCEITILHWKCFFGTHHWLHLTLFMLSTIYSPSLSSDFCFSLSYWVFCPFWNFCKNNFHKIYQQPCRQTELYFVTICSKNKNLFWWKFFFLF